MRCIATRLDVKAASLYGHVAGKQELLTWIQVSDADFSGRERACCTADSGSRSCYRHI